MLRKSSQCDEGKNIHNSGFNCENPKKIIENSENNVPSISYVRNNLLFNCIFVNNVGIKLQFFSDSHRDRCKSPVNQPTRSLYISRKQVLLYTKLAFKSLSLASSESEIINQISNLNFNPNHNFNLLNPSDYNNSYSHNRTLTAIPIQNLITYSLLLLISFHNPSSHISNDESFGCVPGDIPENVKTTFVEFVGLILGWHSRPKQYNIHLRLRTLVNERVMKEDDQENVTENVAEENIKVNYQKIYLSVVSVAKAWSRLSNPSIIII